MALQGTVSVWAARPAVMALRARGVDESPVLRAAQLSARAVDDVESRLAFETVGELWEGAAAATGDPSLGVHVAEALPKGSLDIIEYLGAGSCTLGEAYQRIAHYIRLYFDGSDVRLIVEPRRARIVRRSVEPFAQYTEFITTYLIERSRQWTENHWIPERVAFQHDRPSDDGELSRALGCPIHFSAPETEIRLAPKLLKLPHLHADSRLLAILSRYADAQLATLPARGDVVARARAALARQLATTSPTLAATADALKMHSRTLQRQLADKGVSHSALLEEVRRELALKYIADAALSVNEIAYLLRFSDGTAFARAFKRWTGVPPLQYRKDLLTAS